MTSNGKKDAMPTCLGIPMKWVSLLLLVAQTVGVVFMMRLSRTSATTGPRYLNTTAVFFSEVLKMICSYFFLCYEKGDIGAATSLVCQTFTGKFLELLKVSIPGLLYTVQNNLLFISLSNLSGAVYQVTYQLKILTTAILSVIILGKALGTEKWCALLMLTGGVTLIQMPRGDAAATAHHAKGNQFVGLVAVLCACMTSGLAGVYLEKILKQSDTSIWLRNIQLGLIGAILGLAGCFMQDGEAIKKDGFLQGYNNQVLAVILLQAVGGLVVAAVLKYADNILKCFGNALSIVISCLLSASLLQEFVPDLHFLMGTVLVLSATSLYSLGVPQEVVLFFQRISGNKSKMEDMEAV